MARLSGLGAVILIAGGGAATYVVGFHPAAHNHPAALPTSQAGQTQTVGLIAEVASSGGSGVQLVQMLVTHRAPTFSPLSAGDANGQGNPPWTAEPMTGSTYIFGYFPDGLCLGAAAHARLVLQHCVVRASGQRWRRVSTVQIKDGHDFYQYANLGDGKCLAELPGVSGQQVGAGLARCSKAYPPSQMLAFWWLTV
jgi:hypothetical protein